MTIAAAYSIENRPVLFTDMMLTAPKRQSETSRLNPTQPYAETVLAGIGLVNVGSARKAVIVNGQLAVAWCGNYSSARQVIARLKLIFEKEEASLAKLQQELSYLDEISPDSSCQLVGWLSDGPPVCFRWDSRSPSTLETGQEFVAGSGAAHFQTMVREPRIRGASEECAGVDLAEFALASQISSSLYRDWKDNTTTINGFGYWYEAILLDDDGHFRYVDSIQFSAWLVDFDASGKVVLLAPPSIVIQARSLKRFAVVQTTWINQDRKATDTYVDVVGDGTDSLEDINPRTQLIRSEAKHVCWAFNVSIENRRGEITLVTESGNSFGGWVADKESPMRFNSKALFRLFDFALNEAQNSPRP